VPRFGRGRFTDGKPEEIGGVRFVEDSVLLSPEDVDLDQENAAVRLSNIEEYLQENSLVDDLNTLSIEQLVFENGEGEKYQVPYKFMGDGFRAMLGVLWELSGEDRRNNILLLEEAENHMHPEYIHELSYQLGQILQQKNIQTFITTHNIDFIRSFLEIEDKELEKFLIEQFKLLKMDPDFPEEYDYIDAKEHATNLQLDLRG
jgi:AAA15 family ATPase/GTPase